MLAIANSQQMKGQFIRTVTNVGTPNSTYHVSLHEIPDILQVTVKPSLLSFSAINEEKVFLVKVSGPSVSELPITSGYILWEDGSMRFEPNPNSKTYGIFLKFLAYLPQLQRELLPHSSSKFCTSGFREISHSSVLELNNNESISFSSISGYGRLYEFSSSDIKTILERYREYTKTAHAIRTDEEEYLQQQKFDTASMAKQIEILEHCQRRLMGYGLNSCTYDELRGLENQLETSLHSIRQRKSQLFAEHLERLQAKERNMVEEHARLTEMMRCVEKQSQQSEKHKEVETELFIGLPHQSC
ncbi:hypothetical protein L6164_006136 [Bauhinia variegata]|uniref:Uncharacterized protein n=1 Tax=Bauhinia variegata TaxID=167791 RepID=A0ACB9PU19_BAUVA|nr:hypothetical protein L6164_006136 [Bauhinia variegata]